MLKYKEPPREQKLLKMDVERSLRVKKPLFLRNLDVFLHFKSNKQFRILTLLAAVVIKTTMSHQVSTIVS